MRNKYVELCLNLSQRFRTVCLKDFLSGALAALLFNFERRHNGEHSCDVI